MNPTPCDYLNNYGITLYVGGCADGGRWFRRQAHAHNDSKGEHFGSICFLSAKRLYNADGSPSNTLKHELAHMLAVNHGHDQLWAAVLRSLGGRVSLQHYRHLK